MFPASYFTKVFYAGSYFPPAAIIVKKRPAYPGPGAFSMEYATDPLSFEAKKRRRRRWKNWKQEEEILLYLLMEEDDE